MAFYVPSKLCQVHGVASGAITIGCDCMATLNNALRIGANPHPHDAHFDLLNMIKYVSSMAPFRIMHCYVKGHQFEKGLDLNN